MLLLALTIALHGCQDEDNPTPVVDGGNDATELDAEAAPATAQERPRDTAIQSPPLDAGPARDAAMPPIAVQDAGIDAGPPCAELSYDNFGQEFIYTWCQSCHGQMEPKLNSHEQVLLHALEIRAETVDSERMPAGGGALYLRKAEREKLGRWLECGTP